MAQVEFNRIEKGLYLGESFDTSDRYIVWEIVDGVMDITGTYVDKKYGGKGLGSKLVYAAGDIALEEGLKIKPTCPFAEVVLKRKDKYREHLVD